MTYPFNVSIPAANNQLADDQPVMQSNNNSTYDILNVDHVSFNNSAGGRHTKITFNANQGSDPSIVSGVCSLFPKLDTNTTSQVFFKNNAGTQQLTNLVRFSNTQSSGSGYSIDTPWGFKMYFGNVDLAASSNTTITFAIPMVSGAFTAQVTPNTNAPNTEGSVSISGITTTQATIYRGSATGGPITIFYLIIGV